MKGMLHEPVVGLDTSGMYMATGWVIVILLRMFGAMISCNENSEGGSETESP